MREKEKKYVEQNQKRRNISNEKVVPITMRVTESERYCVLIYWFTAISADIFARDLR